MKYLLTIALLIVATMVTAEVQVGLGTQLIQEIGTDPYFPLVGQVKWIVPLFSGVSVEARGIGQTYKAGDSSTYDGGRSYSYAGLSGVGYRLGDVVIAAGGGVHYFHEEYVPQFYYSIGFDLNYLQRVEFISTYNLTGERAPMGAGFVFSIGI